MHPPSSSVRVIQAKVTICQQKFVPVIIRRVHHVPFTSLTVSRLRTRSPFVARRLDRYCRIKRSHTSLAMYTQTNVGLLCCVGSGSSVAVALGGQSSLSLARDYSFDTIAGHQVSNLLRSILLSCQCLGLKSVEW